MTRYIKSLLLTIVLTVTLFLTTTPPVEAGITRYLQVHNTTNEVVYVYVNNQHVVTLQPGRSASYYVGDAADRITALNAESRSGRTWSRAVPDNRSDYTWYP